MRTHLTWLAVVAAGAVVAGVGAPAAARPRGDDRVTGDDRTGSYVRLDGSTDALHDFCSTSRRSQAEPAVAVNPRDTRVIVAAAADQCYGGHRQIPITQAQGWLGLYRSADGGNSWRANLMPGYPGDGTPGLPAAACGQADATMAFDTDGRLFYGALCPEFAADQAGPADFQIVVSTFDQDGSRYVGTVAASGSTPDPTISTDKPNLSVDITGGPHAGNIYVVYSACPRIVAEQGPASIAPCAGNEGTIELTRSTDHGRTFSEPTTIEQPDVNGEPRPRPNFADVAVGPDGDVYVTATTQSFDGRSMDVLVSKSENGGTSFTPFTRLSSVDPFNSAEFAGTGNGVGAADEKQAHPLPCGDGAFACASGFTFSPIRTLSAVAADADGVHVAWSAQLPSGQAKVFVQSSPDGLQWPRTPVVVDAGRKGHQWYPDIASADGVLRVVFYDSRADRAYAPDLPPGNTADGKSSGPSVDTYQASSSNGGRTWTARRLSTVSQQPGLNAQLGARVPWLGDYLYVSAVPGGSYAVWADARDVVPGTDARGGEADGFDVSAPCTWLPATENLPGTYPYVSPAGDSNCLSQGGLDVNIYGAALH